MPDNTVPSSQGADDSKPPAQSTNIDPRTQSSGAKNQGGQAAQTGGQTGSQGTGSQPGDRKTGDPAAPAAAQAGGPAAPAGAQTGGPAAAGQVAQPPYIAATPLAGVGAGPVRTADQYNIPDEVKARYPDLIELIIQTDSMNDDERNYWFGTLPIMSDEQVQTLKNILVTEREKLLALDSKYKSELEEIDKQQIAEWKEHKTKEKKKAIKTAEIHDRATEEEQQEEILKELDEL